LKDGDLIDYASPTVSGDKITMTVDLRTYKNKVSFARNGYDLGVAFSGLNYWGDDIYIMFSIWQINHRIKIIKYEVEE
jgi:hypothetical protein